MESVGKIKKAIITFLVLNFGLSSIFYFFIGSAGDVNVAGGLYIIFLMYCPAAAAIITSLIFYKSIKDFGWKPGKVKYLAMAYALPIICAIVAYGLFWITTGTFTGKLPPQNMIYFILMGTFTSIIGGVLGEEIGWRGFLVPQMSKITSFSKVAILTGTIWAIWHFPLMIFANYNAGIALWYSLPMFTVAVIGLSTILAWFRLRSGSIWPPILLHASSNLYVQNLFDPLTMETGIARYFVGETGILFAGCLLVFAYITWKMRDKLPDNRITVNQN